MADLINRDSKFLGLSILDLEALRVQAGDELVRVQASDPASPSIRALTDHLGRLTTETVRLA
ncbi:MAG TPA: hypothetical protein VN969_06415 [Streptosporangiaceae bacterium]|jgi:hypothetical protein|nr:hypothetical protein [Streptosporangiaceae bacterium]